MFCKQTTIFVNFIYNKSTNCYFIHRRWCDNARKPCCLPYVRPKAPTRNWDLLPACTISDECSAGQILTRRSRKAPSFFAGGGICWRNQRQSTAALKIAWSPDCISARRWTAAVCVNPDLCNGMRSLWLSVVTRTRTVGSRRFLGLARYVLGRLRQWIRFPLFSTVATRQPIRHWKTKMSALNSHCGYRIRFVP